MNIVSGHELIVLDLLSFKSFFRDMSLGYFPAEDLASNEVSSCEDKLHLIQNEVNLFLSLKRTIGLNLDLLNDLGGFFSLAVLFEHFAQHAGAVGVLALQEQLAI